MIDTRQSVTDILIAQVTDAAIRKAIAQDSCPAVLRLLIDLGWSRKQLGQYLAMEPASISAWVTAARLPTIDREQALYHLLARTLEHLEESIRWRKESDEWPLNTALEEVIAEAKTTLRKYRIARLRAQQAEREAKKGAA